MRRGIQDNGLDPSHNYPSPVTFEAIKLLLTDAHGAADCIQPHVFLPIDTLSPPVYSAGRLPPILLAT
jgi:hypothetical protein